MKKYFFFLLFIIPFNLLAQTGKITGKVISVSSGQALPNATLTLVEKSRTTAADQNGNFSFSRLTPGNYSIKCTYGGFLEKIIYEIIVKDADNTAVTISLEEKTSAAVVVKSTPRVKAAGETVASLLIAQKNSASVSDGITTEQIKRTPDKSTSDVLKRVSGASIQDDRFAVIRGLNDRYNAALINGAPLPSTESDRKAFAFDIFPSALLDNLVIYKTATADKTGEFAGGIIDVTTKSIPAKNFTSISFGNSINSLSTGKTRFYSENKGKKDWLGIDDGTRAMPAGLPSAAEIRSADFAKRAELAKLFGNYRWGIKKDYTTKPNFSFQLSKGLNIEKKKEEFIGALFSINYYRNYTLSAGERNSFDSPSYLLYGSSDTIGKLPEQRNKYIDSVYNEEVVFAALANFAVKINNRNKISFKNNFSINTDNKLIKRVGNPDYAGDSTTIVKQEVRWFTSNQIFSSQLSGEHLLFKKTKLNWLAAYSKVEREIPNLSRTGGSIVSPPSQTTGSGTMFFSNSNENIKSFKADVTQPYTFMKNSQNSFKIGAGYQVRKRDFTSRLLGFQEYSDGNNNVVFDNSLSALPEDQIFLRQHLGLLHNGKGGFMLGDGTLSNSDYKASSELTHAYIMNDQRFFKKFRLIYGLRLESFNQKLTALKNPNEPVNIDSTVTDLLPSANFVYALTPKTNIRLSYSTTVNRPEFRELAPFLFFDNQTTFLFEGTPDLKRAIINNYDFRYEVFPGKAQLISVSAFYKHFKNPIEIISIPNTTSQTKYINTSSANVYGAEVEFRLVLSALIGIKKENAFLSRFTLSANGAYIKSNVKLKDSLYGYSPSQLFKDRALLGQSPYIINTSLAYSDEKNGFSTTVSVNRVGDRIYIAGAYNTGDIYEKARTVLDIQLTKTFLKDAIELKFTAKDILAQRSIFYFDYDLNKSYTPKDRYFSNTVTPRIYTLTASLKL